MRSSLLFLTVLVALSSTLTLSVSAIHSSPFARNGNGNGVLGLTPQAAEALRAKVEALREAHGNENGNENGNGGIVNGGGDVPPTTSPTAPTSPSTNSDTIDECAVQPGQCPTPYPALLQYSWSESDIFKQNIIVPTPYGPADLGFTPADVLLNPLVSAAFFKLPPTWLKADCSGNELAIADIYEFVLTLAQLPTKPELKNWALTLFCKAHLPCLYCYDMPVVPAGASVISLPHDAILQKTFSFGWWYFAATLRPLLPTPTPSPIDVVLTMTYYPLPKYIQEVLTWDAISSGAEWIPSWFGLSGAVFSLQTPTGHAMVSDATGFTSNPFDGLPDSTTTFHPSYLSTVVGLGMDIEHVGGVVGTKGARYAIRGTTNGASVNLIGKAVSDPILQGGYGYQSSPFDEDGLGGQSPFAGTNYFSTRLDMTGSVTQDGVTTAVTGEADFDMQWGHGNPNPANSALGWIWYNFRLPGQCNVFINVFRDGQTNEILTDPASAPLTIVHSDTLRQSVAGKKITQKNLGTATIVTKKTWTSPWTNIVYPSITEVTIPTASGSLWGKFLVSPRYVDAEFYNSPTDPDTLWEGGITVQTLAAGPEYRRDCSGSVNEVGAGLGYGEYVYYGRGERIPEVV